MIIQLSLFILFGLILSILASCYTLMVWFDGAKFFIEYSKLFRLDKYFPHLKDYLQSKEQGSSIPYLEYIQVYKDNFLTRLVTCDKCLSFWVAALIWIYYCLLGFIFFKTEPLYGLLISPLAIPAIAFKSYKLYKTLKY